MPGPVLQVLVHRDKNGSMAPGRRETEEGVCLALALASLFFGVCTRRSRRPRDFLTTLRLCVGTTRTMVVLVLEEETPARRLNGQWGAGPGASKRVSRLLVFFLCS